MQPKEIILSTSLHGFCDSSSQVYCGMVYIRMEITLGIRVSFLCASSQVYCGMVYIRVEITLGIRVSFLYAKTKVAPLKKLSIPRLELLGCDLLSKILKDVLVALKGRVSIDSANCWLDSEVALC